MPESFRFGSYLEGRRAAREAVIKQIYVKYYRRKFANGNFRASWIPDAEKLRRIYERGNSKDTDDRCMLLTINPGVTQYENCYSVIDFLLRVLERIREYKDFLPLDAEFCIEHRRCANILGGIHIHVAHSNDYGISKSEFIRRVYAACNVVVNACPDVLISEQSIDVKFRPSESAVKYIKKNRETDVMWGFGYQGMVHQNLFELRERLAVSVLRNKEAAKERVDAGDVERETFETPLKKVIELLDDDLQEEEGRDVCFVEETQIVDEGE